MALQGTLRDFSLPDIIQLISLSKKTGAVEITSGEGEGTGLLYFDGGRIVAAQLAEQGPLDAACAFFLFKTGFFRFLEGEQSASGRTINQSNEMVILEGIRRAEEWKNLSTRIRSLDTVLKLVVDPAGGNREINLKPEEWRVLTLVNGQDSIRMIGRKTGLGEMKTAQIVFELLKAGLVEGSSARPQNQPPINGAPRRPATAPLSGTGPLNTDTERPSAPVVRRAPGTAPLSPNTGPLNSSMTNGTGPLSSGNVMPPRSYRGTAPLMGGTGPLRQPSMPRGPLLFNKLEGLAISELGITGRMLLNEAYRRLRLEPGSEMPAALAGDLCDQFENSAITLLGAERSRSLANMLRHAAAEVYG